MTTNTIPAVTIFRSPRNIISRVDYLQGAIKASTILIVSDSEAINISLNKIDNLYEDFSQTASPYSITKEEMKSNYLRGVLNEYANTLIDNLNAFNRGYSRYCRVNDLEILHLVSSLSTHTFSLLSKEYNSIDEILDNLTGVSEELTHLRKKVVEFYNDNN